MTRILTLFGAIVLLLAMPGVVNAAEPQMPRALIIGDSISLGYTPHVKRMLEDVALVEHNRGNAQHSGTGVAKLESWLGDQSWDVIHFNWGLWDLCYRHPDSEVQGHRDKVNGTITTSLAQYEKNLRRLVAELQKSEATLIWASTTVVPPDEAGRVVGDDEKYNQVAARVMRENGVAINDLHALTVQFEPQLFVQPGDVHYTPDGYTRVARQVADAIREALAD